jgi:hypothetical protein
MRRTARGVRADERSLAESVLGRGAEGVREVVAGVDHQPGQLFVAAGGSVPGSWQS